MGLLDELKQEADQKKKGLSDAESKLLQKESYYQEVLLPTLHKIFKFLQELIDHLQVINPEMDISYNIPGYGQLDGLVQDSYKIRTDSELKTKRVILSFICGSPKEIQFNVYGKSDVAEVNAFLRKYRIQYSEWGIRDADRVLIGATFQLKFQIEPIIQFDADVENGRIVLTVRNFEGFTTSQKSHKAENISDEWLDNIGRYVLRQQDVLHQENMSNEALQKLREQIERDKLERERELEEAIKRREEEDRLEEEKKLSNQIRNTISERLNRTTTSNKIGDFLKQQLDELIKKK